MPNPLPCSNSRRPFCFRRLWLREVVRRQVLSRQVLELRAWLW